MQDSNHILLHLSLINGIGPITTQVICERKPADMPWEDLYRLSQAELRHLFDLGSAVAQNLFYGLADDGLLSHELALLERIECKVITLIDPSYPTLLKNIHAPSPVLYVQGADLSTFTKCLAVIGSRDADRYGKQVIESLVPPLVEHGWSIMSGGALGADAMAHAATLKAGGKTIAVLGSGLLHPSPTSNLALFDSILARDGALLSTFPLDTKSRPENFPIRNRIISGLSRGVIVAQAARKSGTRITAQYALEQGRDVFAIPGLIDNPLSEGCHALIQEGAKLISRVEDIFQEYGETSNFASDDAAKFEQNELQQNLFVVEPQVRSPNTVEQTIRSACKKPISLDDLLQQTNIPLSELQTLLFNMQLEGMIQQNFAGLWECV